MLGEHTVQIGILHRILQSNRNFVKKDKQFNNLNSFGDITGHLNTIIIPTFVWKIIKIEVLFIYV